ncbi:hypothetical protein BGAL_0438g00010 [Botrytis galanthina]|uniref:Uncharacterized protein n=1 Tax=Botrytis galanthina TaxID=278940 RepID=A0A4S8QRG2_9HELO|nr:hypothetical protein BGAL_0438g00010 [Botrytis galanthina]
MACEQGKPPTTIPSEAKYTRLSCWPRCRTKYRMKWSSKAEKKVGISRAKLGSSTRLVWRDLEGLKYGKLIPPETLNKSKLYREHENLVFRVKIRRRGFYNLQLVPMRGKEDKSSTGS